MGKVSTILFGSLRLATPIARWIFLSLAVGETLVWACYVYVFPALLLTWEQDLGWSRTQLTLAFSVALIVSALAAPFVGRAIDKGLGQKVFSGSAAMGGICLLLLSQVSQLWQFYAIWLVIGVAMAGSLYEPCFALLTRCAGSSARAAITRISLVAGFAGTVSFPCVYFLSDRVGWQGTTAIFGLVVLLLAVPLLWFASGALEQHRQPELNKDSPVGHTSTLGVLKSPIFLLLATGFTLAGINHNAILSHLLPIMEWKGLTPATGVIIASMIGPMQVLGRLAMMAVENRASMLAIGYCCFLGLILASLSLLGATSQTLFLIGAFVVLQGAGHGVTSIARPVITAQLLGVRNFGTVSGMMALPFGLGFAAAPFLSAFVWQIGTYELVLQFTALLAGLAFIALLIAARIAKPDPSV